MSARRARPWALPILLLLSVVARNCVHAAEGIDPFDRSSDEGIDPDDWETPVRAHLAHNSPPKKCVAANSMTADQVVAALKDVRVLRSNRHYRMADVVKGWGLRYQYDRAVLLTDPKFQGTLLQRYGAEVGWSRQRPPNENNPWKPPTVKANIPLLAKLTRSHCGALGIDGSTYSDALLVHVRTGDDNAKGLGPPGAIRAFAGSINQAIESKGLTSVGVVTALHFGDNIEIGRFAYDVADVARGLTLLSDLMRCVQTERVRVLSHADIDADFCALALSPHVLLHGGRSAPAAKGERHQSQSGMAMLVGA